VIKTPPFFRSTSASILLHGTLNRTIKSRKNCESKNDKWCPSINTVAICHYLARLPLLEKKRREKEEHTDNTLLSVCVQKTNDEIH
jgi:hypothetical protein